MPQGTCPERPHCRRTCPRRPGAARRRRCSRVGGGGPTRLCRKRFGSAGALSGHIYEPASCPSRGGRPEADRSSQLGGLGSSARRPTRAAAEPPRRSVPAPRHTEAGSPHPGQTGTDLWSDGPGQPGWRRTWLCVSWVYSELKVPQL